LKNKGYTLTEILVVLVIIATIVALAWPNFMAIKEKSLNREAKATLALIRAAEKIYRLEQGFYYPHDAIASDRIETDPTVINDYLKLSLPETASPVWSIVVDNRASGSEAATATRSGGGADGRIWNTPFTGDSDTDITCSPPGPNCP
jgi:prepilin-type N-terminal cleavage/methylation domain-containing protein